jgi:hypothetical protein
MTAFIALLFVQDVQLLKPSPERRLTSGRVLI